MKSRSSFGFISLLIVVLSVVLFVVACASETGEPSPTDTSSESAAEATVEVVDASPKSGGTLTVGISTEVAILDPHKSPTLADHQVYQNVVERLVAFDPDFTQLNPELATDWTISDDGLSYTFTLREGVKFHNGKDFTADDVIYSYNRFMNPESPSPYANGLAGVNSLEKVDDHTIVFNLDFPFAAFLSKLEFMWILPADPEGEIDYAQTIVGTGPFEFTEWVTGDHVTLAKFDGYWEEGLPYLDEVIYKPIEEEATRLVELQTGGVNFVASVAFKDVAKLENDEAITVYRTLGLARDHFGFNVNVEPFDNVKVRQAMGYLIDREGIAAAVFEGYAVPAYTNIPKTNWGFNPAIEGAYSYDLEKARQLLEEAGYGDGFKSSIKVTPAYPLTIKIAELIAEAAAEVNVEFEIVQLDFATWIDDVATNDNYEAEVLLTLGGTDPDDFFYQWHHSGEYFNIWRFNSDELDALVEKGRETSDQDERQKIYYEVQELLVEQAPVHHMVYRESVMASDVIVKGFDMYAREDLVLKYVWIDE